MIKKFLFIVLILSTFGFSSCEKIEKRWVVWFETYCDDPWFGDANQSTAIKTYLEDEGAKVFNVLKKVGLNPPQSCNDCHCRNGNAFRVRIRKEDVDLATSLGFIPE